MTIILIIIAFSSFVIYGIAMKRIFSRDHGIAPSMRALQMCGAACALVHLWALWTMPDSILWQWLAFVVYVAGLGVFFAARNALKTHRLTLAFSSDTPNVLIRNGIYNRVRHPFYLAYTLTWLGGVIATTSTLVLLTAIIMVGFYIAAASMEERKFLASPLADQYRVYRQEAGLFWPR